MKSYDRRFIRTLKKRIRRGAKWSQILSIVGWCDHTNINSLVALRGAVLVTGLVVRVSWESTSSFHVQLDIRCRWTPPTYIIAHRLGDASLDPSQATVSIPTRPPWPEQLTLRGFRIE